MKPLDHQRDALASVQALLRLLATAGLPLAAGATLAGCVASEAIGGCWEATVADERSVSFFVDTDDDTVVGAVIAGDGDDAARTDFEGRIDEASGGYRIDASCTGGPSGCEGIADWSLRCALDESGDTPVLRCVGAPFASETELTTCQGSATVPTP